MKNKKIKEKGAALLLYVALISIIMMLLMVSTQSVLSLSLRRNLASTDNLLAGYQAESEVNNFLAKLIAGYITTSDLSSGVTLDKVDAGTTLHIEASSNIMGNKEIQTVTATARRSSAVNVIMGIREIVATENSPDVEIALILDCTSSMNDHADPAHSQLGSRFKQQRIAATESFIDGIKSLPKNNNYHLGLGIFGLNSKWVDTSWVTGKSPVILSPDNTLTLSEIRDIVEKGITDKRGDGICTHVNDYTNIGAGYKLANDYFATHTGNSKKIIVLITDGEPNSREADNISCPPSIYCVSAGPMCVAESQAYMRCQLADSNTFIPESGYYGRRDPSIDSYGITIYSNVSSEVQEIFRKYGAVNGYFNTGNATELPALLDKVLNIIIEKNSSYSLQRVIPHN
jgi:hypothetical protein